MRSSWCEIISLNSWPITIVWRPDSAAGFQTRALAIALVLIMLTPITCCDRQLEKLGFESSPEQNECTWNVFHNYFEQWLDSYVCLFFLKVLERKISTRQSREELIRRGVLKELPEQGEELNHAFKIMWSFILWSFFHFPLKLKMIVVFGR